MSKVIGYAVIREDRGLLRVCGLSMGKTKEEAEAILTVFRLEYPGLGKDAKVVEVRELGVEG